jgi:hypothetical protein
VSGEPSGKVIHKGIVWYCTLILSVLGLACCIPLFFPNIRETVIALAERFIFQQQLKPEHLAEARQVLAALAAAGSCFILFVDFWILTVPGRTLLNRVGFIDTHEAEIKKSWTSLLEKAARNRLGLFCFCIGFFAVMLSVSRAASTGITYDEASTYFDVVYPGILEALMRSQYLNNHLLNSILIRFVCFITQTQFNEFLIRLPSILAYCVYIIFAYRMAKRSNHPYFIFILFISNYYLNEYFGLARGYGMASACILAAFYYFDELRTDMDNKRLFHNFMAWCSLAVLANGIALYTVFSIMAIVVFKYRKNIFKLSNCFYFFIFAFTAVYVIFMSRPGKSLASTHNFYESIIEAVFGTFSQPLSFLTPVIFAVFAVLLLYGMIRTKFKNDYALVYIIFVAVCFISNMVFHRGYPNNREMVPFYPVIVFVVADVLKHIRVNMLSRSVLTLAGILLCFQFVQKINIRDTQDFSNDYTIKREVLDFAIRNTINLNNAASKEKFEAFIDGYHNPTAEFYEEKLKILFGVNEKPSLY